ncbi:MAG: ABC transporter ATP-binding protein [Treponema sp.]|uniref:ABC transporter ATP-binding protein n=1 Tax=Treponema sp. TaxID=166 RepID=UPI001B631169|nr:ABC transporter ATP-binding protein [Treponema sp.]MBP5587124.1 ABC transporter ATP-binding protein [Treponema sp.]MCR5387250.1 ATP-binding cassette domain-containing protein [Treponema sp.]
MELIKTVDLSKEYIRAKNKIKAVDNVNISIEKGKTYGLVGESGSGKSTLASMLTLLTKPTSGKILYDGKDISTFSKEQQKEFHKKVQIVFQNPYESLNPKMKISSIIEEPLIIHNICRTKEERKYLVNEMRTMCALDSAVLDKYPAELSGGQRQRVSIASSMILHPEFLVLDEAVSSLDVLIQAQIINILKLMQKSMKVTYFFISHDLNVISYVSDEIGVMYKGSIVEQGKASDILSNPSHPYTKTLFDTINLK